MEDLVNCESFVHYHSIPTFMRESLAVLTKQRIVVKEVEVLNVVGFNLYFVYYYTFLAEVILMAPIEWREQYDNALKSFICGCLLLLLDGFILSVLLIGVYFSIRRLSRVSLPCQAFDGRGCLLGCRGLVLHEAGAYSYRLQPGLHPSCICGVRCDQARYGGEFPPVVP